MVDQQATSTLTTNQDSVVDLEERTWLPRHARGDPDAFACLLLAYQRPIYSYLVRSGIAESARDDLFQEIFLKIHSAAASYQSSYPLRPWLFTIAVNTVRNYWRSQQHQITTDSDLSLAQEFIDPGPKPEQQAESQELLSWLTQAITQLPMNQREVLMLCTLEGLQLREAAEVLAMPLNSVKTNLRRARLGLLQRRKNLSDGGCDDTL